VRPNFPLVAAIRWWGVKTLFALMRRYGIAAFSSEACPALDAGVGTGSREENASEELSRNCSDA
jgi:hypothetical protein